MSTPAHARRPNHAPRDAQNSCAPTKVGTHSGTTQGKVQAPRARRADIDAINYGTKYTTKLKEKFSCCDQIKFNEPVLKPETPD